jgi:hypothetical protein
MKSKVFSMVVQADRTTKYISHGARRAGSEVWRALYDAKMGKQTVVTTLLNC